MYMFCLLAGLACICFQHSLLAQIRPVGEGLYEKKCETERFKVIQEIQYDPFSNQRDTIYREYDSVVCRLFPLADQYDLTVCDSVSYLISETVDSTYVGTYTVFDPGGGTVTKDSFAYDTLRVYAYEVRCRQIDTVHLFDTVMNEYDVLLFDTIHSTDNLLLSGPDRYTDTTLFFHPHVISPYRPYGGLEVRYRDSIDRLLAELDALLATWPDGIREVPSLQQQTDEIIRRILSADPSVTIDTTAIQDSLLAIIPQTPAYYRAWIARLETALQAYPDTLVRTQEYHIDSVRVLAVIHTLGGGQMTDTFTIRTIPLFYAAMKDTAIQAGEPVLLWAGSPDLPGGGGKYTQIAWYPPLDAATGNPVLPKMGFEPSVLENGGTASLTDSVHIRALLAQNGTNAFATLAPLYIADTMDGDSLLFPIKIKATPELMAMYPHAPESLCEIDDTIKVYIVKGYKVNGYVSYAGLWKPSETGDVRSPDAPQYDGDLVLSGKVQHLPVANVSVYLYDLATGNLTDSAYSDQDGYYAFPQYHMPGKYLITGASPQKASVYGQIGLNGNDATWVQNYVANKLSRTTLPEATNPDLSMWWWAGNVNLSENPVATKGFDGNDATAIQNKVAQKLGNGNKYSIINTTTVLDDWVYSTDTLWLAADTMHHLRGVMRGDADRNYNDRSLSGQLAKNSRLHKAAFARYGKIPTYAHEQIIDYPVLSMDSGYLAGFQLFLYFEQGRVEPLGVNLPASLKKTRTNLEYNVIDDQVLTTWVSKDRPYFHVGDTLLMLQLKLQGKPSRNLSSYFKNNLLQYVVSDTMARIIDWKVAMPQLDINLLPDTSGPWKPVVVEGDTVYRPEDGRTILVTEGQPDEDYSRILSVIPNPIANWGDATYYVNGNCLVNLKLYSLLGENVLTFVDGEHQQGLYRFNMDMQSLPSGIYILRLETSKQGKTEFDIVKVIVKR